VIARLAILGMFAVIILLALLYSRAPASAGEYPTVRELESGLGYSPGKQIPKDVPARGRGWHLFYQGARSVGGGQYDVRIKLR
jgi:hypothetical protein